MSLEQHLAGLLRKFEPSAGPELDAAVTALFRGLNEGHVCVDGTIFPGMDLPALRSMKSVVGSPGEFKPLILDRGRLYLARYWNYERGVADALHRLARPSERKPDTRNVEKCLAEIFRGERPDPDQLAAVKGAAEKNLVIISGGPGTGKTTTVAKILALRQMLAAGPLAIKLAAPTGKAADRLRISVSAAKKSLPESVRSLVPEEASTIHRLLGLGGGGMKRRTPLRLDLLVIDEASMIDLSLMAKVLEALPPEAGLILLGDRDQLDAVQPGSVFGDLCRTEEGGVLRENIFTLTRSYRFDASSGIGSLAKSVNAGEVESAMAILRSDPSGQIHWVETGRPEEDVRLFGEVLAWLRPYFELVDRNAPAADCFAAFNAARLLTPLRAGPGDVATMNARILEKLGRDGDWYPGRPVLVNVNDYGLRLYNGDVGLALPDEDGRLSAVFPGEADQWRRFAPARLPSHDPAYAFTVHKSQGSEFDTVFLIIPPGENPVLSRNLFYTGITRARKKCVIWGAEASLRQAIQRKPIRATGLWDRLRSAI